ncbi:MAG: matrixin family metalloprotease [Nannocystaceae bacterium]|nr:matrixin family metalloprotease [Nannocystaceae bacterium]
MMLRASRSLLSLFVPVALALSACSAEDSQSGLPAEQADEAQPSDPEIEEIGEFVDANEGDVVEVEDGISVRVPPPGNLVAIEVIYDDGNTAVATLVNDAERGVFLVHPDEHLLGLPEGTLAACATKCNENAFSHLYGGDRAKWKSRLDWSYRHNNSPIGKNNAINAFKHAALAIPKQRNTCDLADQSSATQRYLGETTRAPNIIKSGSQISCGEPDGYNVIGWGAIAGGTLAVTCTFATSDGTNTYRIVEADQRYDNSNRSWFAGNTPPNSCNNRFSLRGVATHEFGHAYGLGHTPTQCNQVMAPSVSDCTSKNRKLGRGDVRGVRNLY